MFEFLNTQTYMTIMFELMNTHTHTGLSCLNV